MPSNQYWTLDGDELTLLETTTFESEDALQSLIARYPQLLTRSIDDYEGPNWLLVKREAGINFVDGEDNTRWSVDHLFIDATAIPTLVEVKRASDTRIRREVIGQLLDYAASFRADWDSQRLQDSWFAQVEANGHNPDIEIAQFVDETEFESPAKYWEAVDTHIAANQLRLLIVADELPERLCRIIEYLNEQMEQTEVLGIEIRPRQGPAGSTGQSYSVTVRGATERAAVTKGHSERGTVAEFYEVLRANRGKDECEAVQSLIGALEQSGAHVTLGTSKSSNAKLYVNHKTNSPGPTFWTLGIRPNLGRIYLELKNLTKKPGFIEESMRREFRDRMAVASGSPMDKGELSGYPWFPASVLASQDRRDAVIDVVNWAVNVVNQASSPS